MNNKLLIVIGLVLAGILVAGMVVYNNTASKCEANLPGGSLSAQDAAQKMLDFVNNNLLQGQATASLIESTDDSGLYRVTFDVEGQEVNWHVSKNGQLIFPQVIDLEQAEEPAQEQGKTIGNFSVSSEQTCLEDGKPVVYFFGSETCPHCKWEHPIIKEVMEKFDGLVSFHENMDTGEDMDVFNKYSTGGIPTLVMGCNYYRVGSGESAGAEEEARVLTALTCKLTNGQPGDVCGQVQDLIDQVQ